jgi:hypothetical protein
VTARRGPSSRLGREEGQAAVELALVLPMLVGMALLVLQVALVVRDQVLVTAAAREAARQAAVDPAPGAARAGAASATRLDTDRLDVELQHGGEPGEQLTVVVRYRSPTVVPLVGSLIGDVTLSSRAVMRVEA